MIISSTETSTDSLTTTTLVSTNFHSPSSFATFMPIIKPNLTTTRAISSTTTSDITGGTTSFSLVILCDGNIDSQYGCQQCMDVISIRYLWGSNCEAKKLLSSNMVRGKCGLDAACVTTDIGDCPYDEYCPESTQGIVRF